MIPPTVPEVRRVILAMAGSVEEREFRLGWSRWRRIHQAVAKRCHRVAHAAATHAAATHAANCPTGIPPEPRTAPRPTEPTPPLGSDGLRLTDQQWALIEPLMPPRKPPVGRPSRSDHRAVVGAILWVLSTGASWRDVPEEVARWQTVYGRYRKWHEEGLWPRIVEALRCDDAADLKRN